MDRSPSRTVAEEIAESNVDSSGAEDEAEEEGWTGKKRAIPSESCSGFIDLPYAFGVTMGSG